MAGWRDDKMRVEVHSFKWPRRPISVAHAWLLGEDCFGRWLGVARSDRWWSTDGSCSGTFEDPLVKVVPSNTYWTSCFHPADPIVDVDVVLPVCWMGNILEEVDLELDILRYRGGRVEIRDRELFEQIRMIENIPDEITNQVETTCRQVRAWVEQSIEPFGTVGQRWLAHFIAETE